MHWFKKGERPLVRNVIIGAGRSLRAICESRGDLGAKRHSLTVGIGLIGSLMALAMMTGPAQSQVSFHGKNITMLIGSAPGGGTDAAGRIIARFLGKYLAGSPSVVVQNMPGASGITATNHFMNKTAPDGLTVLMGSQSILDPVIYRNASIQFDTTAIRMAGGIGRGGSLLFISKAAEPRLYDHTAPPVVIGTIGPVPRAGIQPAVWSIEYLGWNAKWVGGYPGTNQLMVAFDRGEVELTSTANIFLIADRLKAGSAKVLFQTSNKSGEAADREDFGAVPNFVNLMDGKISDPLAQKAFAYWVALSSIDKWLGLAPGTPDDIVAAYRDAFVKMSADQEFLALGDKISDGFESVDADKVEAFAKTLAETPPEALGYLSDLMRKQGIRAQ